ncbi:hypothetical protein PSPO01_08641 [Paraphaeosphaeria sporulosa]
MYRTRKRGMPSFSVRLLQCSQSSGLSSRVQLSVLRTRLVVWTTIQALIVLRLEAQIWTWKWPPLMTATPCLRHSLWTVPSDGASLDALAWSRYVTLLPCLKAPLTCIQTRCNQVRELCRLVTIAADVTTGCHIAMPIPRCNSNEL